MVNSPCGQTVGRNRATRRPATTRWVQPPSPRAKNRADGSASSLLEPGQVVVGLAHQRRPLTASSTAARDRRRASSISADRNAPMSGTSKPRLTPMNLSRPRMSIQPSGSQVRVAAPQVIAPATAARMAKSGKATQCENKHTDEREDRCGAPEDAELHDAPAGDGEDEQGGGDEQGAREHTGRAHADPAVALDAGVPRVAGQVPASRQIHTFRRELPRSPASRPVAISSNTAPSVTPGGAPGERCPARSCSPVASPTAPVCPDPPTRSSSTKGARLVR